MSDSGLSCLLVRLLTHLVSSDSKRLLGFFLSEYLTDHFAGFQLTVLWTHPLPFIYSAACKTFSSKFTCLPDFINLLRWRICVGNVPSSLTVIDVLSDSHGTQTFFMSVDICQELSPRHNLHRILPLHILPSGILSMFNIGFLRVIRLELPIN